MGLWVLCMEQKYAPLLLYGVWLWYVDTGLYVVCILYGLGLTLYNRPQLRMVLPFGISKFFDIPQGVLLVHMCISTYVNILGQSSVQNTINVIEYPYQCIHSQPLSFTIACIVVYYMNVCTYVYIYVCRYIDCEDVYRKFPIQIAMRLNHVCHEFL